MGANWLPLEEPVWLRPFRDGLTFLGFEGGFASDAAARLVAATDNGTYRVLVAAVVYPRAPGDLTRIVRAAQAAGVAVSPRGCGTGNDGRSLTTDVMANVSHHPVQIGTLEAEASLVAVEPDVVLDQFNACRRATARSSRPWSRRGGGLGQCRPGSVHRVAPLHGAHGPARDGRAFMPRARSLRHSRHVPSPGGARRPVPPPLRPRVDTALDAERVLATGCFRRCQTKRFAGLLPPHPVEAILAHLARSPA